MFKFFKGGSNQKLMHLFMRENLLYYNYYKQYNLIKRYTMEHTVKNRFRIFETFCRLKV